MQTQNASIKPGLSLNNDYCEAIRTTVWLRDDTEDYLLFCSIELLPIEQELRFIGIDNHIKRIGNTGRRYFRGMREKISVVDALTWFQTCGEESVSLINKDGVLFDLLHSDFFEEPHWPDMVSAEHMGWMASDWDTPRIGMLLQETVPDKIFQLTDMTQILEWIQKVAGSDLSEYEEYLGAIILVAPNPLFREIDKRLVPQEDGSVLEIFRFVSRACAPEDELKFYIGSIRPLGPSNVAVFSVKPGSQIAVRHIGNPERTSYAIVCPQRGVLAWHGPVYYVLFMNFNMALITGKKEVHVPPKGRKGGAVYRTDFVSDENSFTVGKRISETTGASILLSAERRRKSRKQRIQQRWFGDDPEEATNFIHGLVSKAKRRLLIVDPYAATRELFNYALATSRLSVDITVLTSSECLKQKIDQETEIGDQLEEVRQRLQDDHPELSLEVLVMSGSRPAIHDRFVVIDDEIWMIGPSLNELGTRGGMALRVPYPEEVAKRIAEVFEMETTLSLPVWVVQRRAVRKEVDGAILGWCEKKRRLFRRILRKVFSR